MSVMSLPDVVGGTVRIDGTNGNGNARGLAIARTGAGAYTATPLRQSDATERLVLVGPQQAATRGVRQDQASNALLTLNADIGGAAADTDFAALWIRLSAMELPGFEAIVTGLVQATGVVSNQRGLSVAPANGGAGIVTLSLLRPLNSADGFMAAPALAAGNVVRCADTSDLVKTLTADVGGAAANTTCGFLACRVREMMNYPDVYGITASIAGGTGVGTSLGGVVARTGAGAYTWTLDRGLDITEGFVAAFPRGAATRALRVTHTSATVKTITADIGGAAADTDWCAIAIRVQP